MNSSIAQDKRWSRRQAGVGMIELLVAMLLGAVLIIGIMQMFTTSRQTFRVQDASSLISESGTYAMDFLGRDLMRAGATINPLSPEVSPFVWAETVDGGVGGNDSIAIAYEAQSTLFPDAGDDLRFCTGEQVPAGITRIANRYWVNANDQLMCQGMTAAGSGLPFVPFGTAQAMLDNIDSFQVLFGVDTAHPVCDVNTRRNEATLYVPASRIADVRARGEQMCDPDVTEREWLRTVRIGLLLRTPEPAGTQTDQARTFTVLDQTIGLPDVDPADGRLRRQFTRTVVLRNLDVGLR